MKLSVRDARLQIMRGNLDSKTLKKEEPAEDPVKVEPAAPVIKEVPVPANVTIDTTQIAAAISQQALILGQAMQALQPKDATNKWVFRITERDRAGNIVSFTAEAK
jgi:hypothetical protein